MFAFFQFGYDFQGIVAASGPSIGCSKQIHGARGGSFDGTFTAFQKDIHPEDRPEVSAAVQESVRSGKPYHVHYRLAAQSDKEERWVEAMATVIQESGIAVRMLGTCRDVTDRQRLLRELRVRAKQQEAVARLGERALTEPDLQKLFDEIATTIAEMRADPPPMIPLPRIARSA